jgi:hypothetical protein
MSSCPVYTGSNYIHFIQWRSETALYCQWFVIYRCPLRQVWLVEPYCILFWKWSQSHKLILLHVDSLREHRVLLSIYSSFIVVTS